MSWLESLSRKEAQWIHKNDLLRFATLRTDIERMGARLHEQNAANVQSGHPHRLTRSERHAVIRELLTDGLSDREVARRLGISPTTVGAVRRQG
jgi:DNA-binding NarL/FixJ family response regulator